MTNRKTTRARTKRPAPKLPAKESAASTPDQKTPTQDQAAPVMVSPLSPNTFKLVMQIIDNADFKGREVSQVLVIKLELARVANLSTQTGNEQ